MLDKLLNRQVKIAAFLASLVLFYILGAILIVFGSIDSANDGKIGLNAMWWAGLAILVLASLSHFGLWIGGIVNAFSVNSITKDSAVLIVFSIFTFWIVHLIVAIMERNKRIGVTINKTDVVE